MKNKEKVDKINIFDFLKSITVNKQDLSDHERFRADYSRFMINKWLSMTNDLYCISLAMYLSTKSDMDKVSHYKFLLYELPKGYRNFKYQKSKSDYDKDVVNSIKMWYNISDKKCLEVMKVLNEEQLEVIKKKFGGVK